MGNMTSSIGTAGATRQAQVSGADWSGGMNLASCQPGVGINTGDYDPKLQDWPLSDWNGENAAPYVGASQFIGGVDPSESNDADTGNGTPGNTTKIVLIDPVVGNSGFTYIQADGNIANDGELSVGSGVFNKTGKTVPAGSYCWGVLT